MSAAGIPMFYGAVVKRTAKHETPPFKGLCAIAKFKLLKDIVILDLTDVPVISIFDEDRVDLYDWSLFMNEFLRDFSKPVRADGREHIEYVPTQVVTEYFRSIAKADSRPISGVEYRSARDPKGICYVLFAEQGDVKDEQAEKSESERVFGDWFLREKGGYLLERIALHHENYGPILDDEIQTLLEAPSFADDV